MALGAEYGTINPQFQGILNAIRQNIRGPGGSFARQGARLAQNISTIPGLRGSGVSTIPEAALAGSQAQAESGAFTDVLGQQEQQRFGEEQAELNRNFQREQFERQAQLEEERGRASRRRAYQTAIRDALIGSAARGVGGAFSSAGRGTFANQAPAARAVPTYGRSLEGGY
jgi:hypothetical protein